MHPLIERQFTGAIDLATYVLMNGVQLRHRLPVTGRALLEAYIADGEKLTVADYYRIPEFPDAIAEDIGSVAWRSSITSGFPKNDRAFARLHVCERGWSAPTLLMIHALMSFDDMGYSAVARRFNALGWNACFIHLPYHYSRRPRGYLNGELCITADLVRTAEGVRQSVCDLRQLMQILRARGTREFGMVATSYGGWVGALLLAVEADFRFAALMQPIVNTAHAIWESPVAASLRRYLRRQGIDPALTERHAHLMSPMHQLPLCGGERVIIGCGESDRISPPAELEKLRAAWIGSTMVRTDQGHFGYRLMPALLETLERRNLL